MGNMVRGSDTKAMEKYVEISKKLTQETMAKYLTPSSSDYIGYS